MGIHIQEFHWSVDEHSGGMRRDLSRRPVQRSDEKARRVRQIELVDIVNDKVNIIHVQFGI